MSSKRDRIVLWSVIILPVVCIGAFLVLTLWANKGPKYDISNECIKVKGGGYHATIPVADITSDSVWEHWPGIAMRTNGMSVPGVNMGHFRLKNGEECMLFILRKGGPLLELRTVDGGLYYLNCAREEETLGMIEEVKEAIRSRQTTGYNDNHTLCPHGGVAAICQEIADQVRNDDKESSLHGDDVHPLCPHSERTFAISQARRRIPNAWEIADQVRNDDKRGCLAMTERTNKSIDL